jgi:hypothetical protein
MRVHRWLVVVSVLLAASASEAAPEPNIDDTHNVDLTATTRVPVLLYSAVADLTTDDRLLALDIADEALSTASVGVDWTFCGPGDCLIPLPTTLKVRLVFSPDAHGPDSDLLGHALIDSKTRSGVLATVYVDRTRRLAGDLGIDHRVLLGRTIAHELGHLLLATSTHARGGLMRKFWSRDELLGTRRDDWIFDRVNAAAIRKRLVRLRIARSPGAS